MLIQILTLFPEMFTGPLNCSIIKRAQEQGKVAFRLWNYREFTTDKHRTVDDTPYGGGCGMVLKPEPIYRCLQAAKTAVVSNSDQPGQAPGESKVILLTPQGRVFRQDIARDLAQMDNLIMICGHYEGFDERIRQWADMELSIGDYVLTGGEFAALVICDAVTRLVPGVLGSEESAIHDSFTESLLDYPQYTKPPFFEGLSVPEILFSGHHAKIASWRHEQALLRTMRRRPDLLETMSLSDIDLKIMEKLRKQNEQDSMREEVNP